MLTSLISVPQIHLKIILRYVNIVILHSVQVLTYFEELHSLMSSGICQELLRVSEVGVREHLLRFSDFVLVLLRLFNWVCFLLINLSLSGLALLRHSRLGRPIRSSAIFIHELGDKARVCIRLHGDTRVPEL